MPATHSIVEYVDHDTVTLRNSVFLNGFHFCTHHNRFTRFTDFILETRHSLRAKSLIANSKSEYKKPSNQAVIQHNELRSGNLYWFI